MTFVGDDCSNNSKFLLETVSVIWEFLCNFYYEVDKFFFFAIFFHFLLKRQAPELVKVKKRKITMIINPVDLLQMHSSYFKDSRYLKYIRTRIRKGKKVQHMQKVFFLFTYVPLSLSIFLSLSFSLTDSLFWSKPLYSNSHFLSEKLLFFLCHSPCIYYTLPHPFLSLFPLSPFLSYVPHYLSLSLSLSLSLCYLKKKHIFNILSFIFSRNFDKLSYLTVINQFQ